MKAPRDAGSRHVTVPFVDLRAGYAAAKERIDEALGTVIGAGDFILGEAVREFEDAFADYVGVAHAVGVDSGFSALELALRALGIGPGDEVITAANTFVATVAAIEATGARAVLVDMLADSYTLDPEQLEDVVTPATRAVVPVHLYGQPADMTAIRVFADAYDLVVVEDACQAHGAWYRGTRAGALGHAAAFSFYPAKNLGAFGDGGMVVTDDDAVADRVRRLRNLGGIHKYEHAIKGFNRRLDSVHAAVLTVRLEQLDADNERRVRRAQSYAAALAGLPVQIPVVAPNRTHVFHLYVVEVEDRAAVQTYLAEAGIASGIHYPAPVHLQPPYRSLGAGPGSFPVAEAAAQRILSLPMHPYLTDDEVAYVGRVLSTLFEQAA